MYKQWIGGLVLLLTGIVANAAAPREGIVQEGIGVPGVQLGATRAQVEANYGAPGFCQSIQSGDYAVCTFPVTGGGQVNIRYTGPQGGNASHSPYDVVRHIQWYPGVNWVTTAGITADLALNDPETLLQAYPNAEVTYHSFTGQIYSVIDKQLGFSVIRWYNFYSGQTSAYLSIYPPQTAQ